MKELRKRVNGLIAILLAVCLSLEMSGGDVYAAQEYSFGDYADYRIADYVNEGQTQGNDIAGVVLSAGDSIMQNDSGGYFSVVLSDTTIGQYVNYSERNNGNVTYTNELTITEIPDEYDGIQVKEAKKTEYLFDTGYYIKQLTFDWYRQYARYNLTFDVNGGTTTGVIDDITNCKFGSNEYYPLPEIQPERQGYLFEGWSFSSDRSGTTYQAGDEITLPNNEITTITDGQELTLYAVWEPYTFNANFYSGSADPENNDPIEEPIWGSYDQPITLPECTYSLPNYHFAGWKYIGVDENVGTIYPENVGTIYPAGSTFEYLPDYDGVSLQFEAQWDPNTVSISYDANGGTGTMAGATYTYDGSIFAYLLPGADGSLSKDGYRFIGWCENADGSSDIMPEGYQYPLDFSEGNQDITLYAIWEPNAYSIRFNGNGGTGEMANQAGISSEPTILNPNQFTSIDQMFAGWSTTGTGTVQYADRASFDYKASTNNQVVDLFAIWTKLYKLAFDANGGGGTMDTLLNGIDGIGQTLPECAFTKEGFVFKGWATNPYTLTAEYQPGDTFTYSPQTAGETVTMYAIWEAEGANAADRIQVGLGTVYLTAGQEYFFGEDGVYKVDGDPTAYPMNTIFYVPVSGNYTISVQ